MATARVRSANNATPGALAPTLPRSLTTPLGPATLALHPARHLSPCAQDALHALFDANITSLARGTSMETSPAAKRDEMFDADARFLVVLADRRMPGSMPLTPARGSDRAQRTNGYGNGSSNSSIGTTPRRRAAALSSNGDDGGTDAEADCPASALAASALDGTVDIDAADLLGYASFRFDTEETMGPKDVEVVYCYELHLVPAARGAGLGGVLIRELEAIGRERGMRKSMLTCLTNNTGALAFYAKVGYRPDEIDPTRIAEEDGWEDVDANGDEVHCDYRILSKVLK